MNVMTLYWKAIAGYEGIYECSTDGQVRSLDRIVDNGRGGKMNLPGRIIKATDDGHGYLIVNLSRNGIGQTKKVHRLIAETFLIPIADQVNHRDGCKTNNHVNNLEWVTQSQNAIHAHQIGLYKGKRLSDHEIMDIRERFAQGNTTKIRLGIDFGVSSRTIARVINADIRFTMYQKTGRCIMIADVPERGLTHAI